MCVTHSRYENEREMGSRWKATHGPKDCSLLEAENTKGITDRSNPTLVIALFYLWYVGFPGCIRDGMSKFLFVIPSTQNHFIETRP